MPCVLKASLQEGGFVLDLAERGGDLGIDVCLHGLDDVEIDLPDGTRAPLVPGLAAMLEGMTVTGFVVQTRPTGS